MAGTATATAGAVNRHSQQKQAEKQAYADQQAAEQAPPQPEPVYQAPPPQYQQPAPVAEPAPAEDDLVGKINELAQLKDSGVLSEEEFSAAKGKLLGI